MTEEQSFEELIPQWFKDRKHVLVPGIDTVLLGNGNLAVTRDGFARFSSQIPDADSLIRFTVENFQNGTSITANIKVVAGNPNLVIKHDVGRNAVNNVLVVRAVGQRIPRETDDYVFRPLDFYWAFDQPNGSMIAMSRANPIMPLSQDVNRKYVQARLGLINEARNAGITINPLPYQDLVLVGMGDNGKPIVTLLEENSPQENILEVLSKPQSE